MKPPCARCGCPHAAHQHYDGGTWCNTCGRRGCRAYKRPRWWAHTEPPAPAPPLLPVPGPDEIDQAIALAATAGALRHPLDGDNGGRCSLCHSWLPVLDEQLKRWVLKKEKCPAHADSEEARP